MGFRVFLSGFSPVYWSSRCALQLLLVVLGLFCWIFFLFLLSFFLCSHEESIGFVRGVFDLWCVLVDSCPLVEDAPFRLPILLSVSFYLLLPSCL